MNGCMIQFNGRKKLRGVAEIMRTNGFYLAVFVDGPLGKIEMGCELGPFLQFKFVVGTPLGTIVSGIEKMLGEEC